jgi:HEAT repeat protein
MGTWRNAIVNKDADTVIAIDGAFANEPKKYLEALIKSAETDENERVRAFSTRVLGKRVNPECGPLFIRLLADKSPYVRMNAAWGLGELANTAEGRLVAKPALRALHRIEKQDSSPDTRTAASLAAKRLM